MDLKTSTSNPNNVKQMMLSELLVRIRRGRAWLHVNSQEECKRRTVDYDPVRYTKNLNFYTELVDEIKLRNHTEEEGWEFNQAVLTPEEMTKEEILFLIDRDAVKP